MAIRQVSTDLWLDTKWRKEIVSIKERYLWLYLMTCPLSKTCGIFHLPIEVIVMETKLDISEVWQYLNDLIENGMCAYNEKTEEIAIFNFYKYHIRNANKPIRDMLNKELAQVKDKNLIQMVVDNIESSISECYETNKAGLWASIESIMLDFCKGKESLRDKKSYTNNNTNTYTNNESCHESLNKEEEQALSWDEIHGESPTTKQDGDDDMPF